MLTKTRLTDSYQSESLTHKHLASILNQTDHSIKKLTDANHGCTISSTSTQWEQVKQSKATTKRFSLMQTKSNYKSQNHIFHPIKEIKITVYFDFQKTKTGKPSFWLKPRLSRVRWNGLNLITFCRELTWIDVILWLRCAWRNLENVMKQTVSSVPRSQLYRTQKSPLVLRYRLRIKSIN